MQTKDIQGKLWSSAPADWAKYLEPTFIPMYHNVLSQIQLDEEKMLLDAGCGSGLFLSMAAATGAVVHGIDAAPGLLAISKERLPGTTLLIEDLEALPFIDGTFDVVTGFNSFQYAGSFENALAEAARVVKKNGKVVVGIWGKEEVCESATVHRAVIDLLPPPPPGTPGPFALSEEGKIESFCKSAGLKVINKQTIFCPWQLTGDDALLAAFMCTGPCVKTADIVGEEAVHNAIITSAQPYGITDDVYYMKNYLTVFITEKIS
ncbi:MAG: class I SAM-dependent methyltransferase [Chitinophagaceae bacterium]